MPNLSLQPAALLGRGDLERSAKTMILFDRLIGRLREKNANTKDALAELVLAARDDSEFKKRVLFVLHLPKAQRESLVNSAVEEMSLRGESVAVRAAFLSLATEEGAEVAARLIECE